MQSTTSSTTNTVVMDSNRTKPSSGHRLNPNDFYFGKMLGEGSFSCVYLAKEVRTSKKYAIKVCEKRLILREKKQEYVKREREVLNKLTGRPGFLGLYCTFQDRSKLYFVMTYACNGTLLTLLSRPSFTLDCARFYAAEILLALETMHDLAILHRDIKPENILLDERMHVLIADFGSSKLDYKEEEEEEEEQVDSGCEEKKDVPSSPTMSTARKHAQRVLGPEYQDEDDDTDDNTEDAQPVTRPPNKRRSFVGTAQYVSPEILTGTPSSPASDLWSYGCTIYQMVCGVSPFRAASEYLIFKMILRCQVSYADSFDHLAKDLVTRLLQLEQYKRLGARDSPRYHTIRQHAFFEGIDFEHLRHQPAPLSSTNTESVLNNETVYFPDGMQPGLDDRQITRLFDFKLGEVKENDDVRDEEEDEEDEEETVGEEGMRKMGEKGRGGGIGGRGGGGGESGGESVDKDEADSNRAGSGRVFSLTRSGLSSLKFFKSVEDALKNDPGPVSLWQPFADGEEILKYGIIYKRKGLFARRRMMLLTKRPRLIYIDPVTMVKKGEIPWTSSLSAEAKNFKTFYVNTPNRIYYLEDPEGFALKWCDTITDVHRKAFLNSENNETATTALLLHAAKARDRSFALLDCPPECLCDRNQPEVENEANRTSKPSPPLNALNGNSEVPELGDTERSTTTFHALCMVGQGAGFEKIEDLLSLDTTVLKIIYTSQTEQYQLNASNLVRFQHLRELHLQSLQAQLLRFSLDAELPVVRLHLESLELVRSEPPTVVDRTLPSLAGLGLHSFPDATGNEANAYQIVANEEEEIVVGGVGGGGADTLTETFELEIVPYEVYKRDLASTSNVSFYGWSNLTALSIHDCQLESLHPDFLYGLDRLERLSLQHNNLKILPPFAFYGAPNMRLLSLANNRLLEVSYYSLAGLLELQVLDLSANNISKVSELTFPPFPKLAKLDLRQNPIEYVFDSSFAIANMTRSLFIGSDLVALQIGTPKPFQGLNEMELLEIRNLQVPALNQYLFRGLRSLRTLRLLQGNISFVDYDSFAEMKNLTELYASRCSIATISMDAFFGVKRLQIVDLSHNLLTELPVGLFDELLQLLELYLHGNRLTQLPTDFFRRLAPGVQIVRLIENPWQCSCTMVQWRQAATNRLKISPSTNNPLASYVYSNKLTPRCSDPTHGIQNRSVYYVIRKNLHCQIDSNQAHKIAQRISELNRRKQQELLHKRYHDRGGPPVARVALYNNGVRQASGVVMNSMPGANIVQVYQRPQQSLLYQQKRLRLQQKLQKSQPRYVSAAANVPSPQRITSNDIEF
uniref:3-phosphoinositide-dependent protein kinase 1 n=1 Tax=Anopheles christyi TaxID=43041 RepID=A0A182K126_9DIPT